MSCLLPIKIISISSPAVFRSLVQTSTPIQFSTLKRAWPDSQRAAHTAMQAETNSMCRLRVINAEVHGLFVLHSKSSCHVPSLFQSVPAQFLSFSASVILKMFSEAIGLNFLHTCTIKRFFYMRKKKVSHVKEDSSQKNVLCVTATFLTKKLLYGGFMLKEQIIRHNVRMLMMHSVFS